MVDDRGNRCGARGTGSIAANAWSHLVVVVDRTAGEVRFYMDGKPDSVRPIPAQFTGNLDVAGAELSIGSRWQPMIGLLDEVTLHRRALTPGEITQAYEEQRAARERTDFQLDE
jgi:hypothetical protein